MDSNHLPSAAGEDTGKLFVTCVHLYVYEYNQGERKLKVFSVE